MSFNTTKIQTISRAAESNLPGWSNRISGNFVLCVVVGFAFFQGIAVFWWGSKGAVLTIGMAYMFFLFRWPHLALIAGIVIIFDGLGLINPVTFFRMPGVFRLGDLVFISLFAPLLFNAKWHRRARNVFRHSISLMFPIMVILFLTTFQMVRTWLQYDLPLNSCIMAGRHYWYYAFLPLVAIYLDTSHKRKVVYRLFLVVISALASVVIIQSVMYAVFQIRFINPNIQFSPANWGNMQLFSRIYIPGEPTLVLGFALAFWGVFQRKSARKRVGFAALALLCALALLLVNSRMRWVHMLLVVLIPVFFLGPHISKAGRRLLCVVTVVVFILVSVFALTGRSNDLVSSITARAVSGWTDFRDKKGTWDYRLEDNRFRVQLIRKHPLFGVGFIHIYYAHRFGGLGPADEVGMPAQGITTTDSGIVTLLVDFGAIGSLWAVWYFISVLGFCSKMLRSSKNGDLRWTSLPLIGYMTGGLVTFVTLGVFTMAGAIVGLSFALGILASDVCIKLRSKH
jgi:hypothetical protein